MAVIGTLVVGRNHATTLNGISAPLSTQPDRQRFLALHRKAGAIIIGKNSALRESYEKTSVPIFIFTRESAPLNFSHPMMQQINVSRDLTEITRLIDQRTAGDIVVESGPSLLQALIAVNVVDELELSIAPIDGDGDFIQIDDLLQNFEITSDITVEDTRLLKCRNKRNASNGT